MKLKRLKLINGGDPLSKRYKSLEPFDQEFTLSDDQSLNPICLVGVNGSGKSNLLELIGEIFFYLESLYLKYIPSSHSKKFNILFEIEYYLKVKSKSILVQIKRNTNRNPEFCVLNEAEGSEKKITGTKQQEALLPKRIIAYSSGLNETLSTDFKVSRSLYSEQVGKQANPKSKGRLKEGDFVPPRLMYMDNETNELIVVSNFLFKSKELSTFRDILRIESLHSFRIVIQFNHPAAPNGGIRRTKELDNYVDKLVKCATTYVYLEETDSWILDYFVAGPTIEAFKHYFESAQQLFVAFYKLNLLNPLCVKAMHRKWAIRNDIFPSDKAFRIDHLKLNIKDPTDTIDYIGISDGEHQFMHILGTVMMFDDSNLLYLLDEPETHYNPKWRAEFISSLTKSVTKSPQQFIITTHSPFLLSDTRGHNVFVFRRDGIGIG